MPDNTNTNIDAHMYQSREGYMSTAFLTYDDANLAKNSAGLNKAKIESRVIYKLDENTKQLVDNYPDEYGLVAVSSKITNQIILNGTYRNAYQQLTGIINDTLPGGHYSMNSNPDGTVEISNQKIYGPVYKTYTYNGGKGDVLSFKIEQDFIQSPVGFTSASDVDANKDFEALAICQGTQIVGERLSGGQEYFIVFNEAGETTEEESTIPIYQEDQDKWADRSYPLGVQPINQTRADWFANQVSEYQKQQQAEAELPHFKSEEEATASIQDTDVSTDEWLDYYNNVWKPRIEKNCNTLAQGDNGETWKQIMYDANNIPIYYVQRKVVIDGDFICSQYAKDQNETDIVAKAKSGYKYLIDKYGEDNVTVVHTQTATGYDPNDAIYGGPLPEHPEYQEAYVDKVHVHGVFNLKVPITGQRVLKSDSILNAEIQNSGDMRDSVHSATKATAQLIGDPNLREGLVVNINNVGIFSGKWYVTEVIHIINSSSGYVCNVTFQQKDIEVNQYVVKVGVDMKKPYLDIHQYVKDNYETIEANHNQDGSPTYLTGVQNLGVEKLNNGRSAIYQVENNIITEFSTRINSDSRPDLQEYSASGEANTGNQ